MATNEIIINTEVLNSWKEVATYLGRGVRTVQRWEQELGLPVRRPRGKSRSAVIALKSDLDRWLKEAPTDLKLQAEQVEHKIGINPPKEIRLPVIMPNLHGCTSTLTSRAHLLLARSHDLCKRSKYLCEQVNRTVTLTAHLVDRQNKRKKDSVSPIETVRIAIAS
jgi:hypothetical protein